MIQSKPTHPILRASFSILLAGSIFFVAACEDEAVKLGDEPQLMELSAEEHLATKSDFVFQKTKSKIKISNNELGITDDELSIVISSNDDYIYSLHGFKDEDTYNKVKEVVISVFKLSLGYPDFEEELFNRLAKINKGIMTYKVSGEELSINTDVTTFSNSSKGLPETIDIPGETQSSNDQIFEVVEDQPEPVGGMEAFYELVGQRLRYPEEARTAGIEGRVFIQFVVDEQGNVGEVKAVKGLGHGLDEAAEDMIRETKWEPGKQKGQAVKVRMIMPVMFRLSAD